MLIYNIYTFSFLIAISESITLQDYCKLDKENTPCKYKCVLSSECGDATYETLTDAERNFVVKEHNDVRQEVAKGRYEKQNLPRATNVEVISYDKECEFLADCYIRQCIFDHDMMTLSLKGEFMGQNLYMVSAASKLPMGEPLIKRGISSWYKEVNLVTPEMGQMFMKSFSMNSATGHFTQMVWPSTLYVGCAQLQSIRSKGVYSYYFFCNYKPSGNQPGKPLFATSATTCRYNSQYENLCGEIRPLDQDDYERPNGNNKNKYTTPNVGTSLYPIQLLLIFLLVYTCIVH